jgi:hypothetical protein
MTVHSWAFAHSWITTLFYFRYSECKKGYTGNIEWHKKESEDKQRNKQTSKTTNTRKHNTDPTNQFWLWRRWCSHIMVLGNLSISWAAMSELCLIISKANNQLLPPASTDWTQKKLRHMMLEIRKLAKVRHKMWRD